MAYDLKITVYNNRDYEQSFTLQDSEGAPLDLSDSKLIFAIANSTRVIQTHDSSLIGSNKCIFIDNAATGEIRLVLPYTVLKTITAASYTHDLILVDADDKRSGVWAGQMVVKKGVA
jgi:hypothetical protein